MDRLSWQPRHLQTLAVILRIVIAVVKRQLCRLAFARVVLVELCAEVMPIRTQLHGCDDGAKVLPQFWITHIAGQPLKMAMLSPALRIRSSIICSPASTLLPPSGNVTGSQSISKPASREIERQGADRQGGHARKPRPRRVPGPRARKSRPAATHRMGVSTALAYMPSQPLCAPRVPLQSAKV